MTSSTVSACPERLADALSRASSQARASARQVLVSVVEPVPGMDPLASLEALGQTSAEGRMYWARPSDSFSLAGIGMVARFSLSGSGRFAETDRLWRALLTGAVVEDGSDGLGGVGPMLLGGFAFEPGGPREPHWRGFPSALLTLPRMQLTAAEGRHWLTTTVLVAPDGSVDVDPADLARMRDLVLAPPPAAQAPSYGGVQFADPRGASDWRALVRRAVDDIRTGRMDKVVLARSRQAQADRDIDAVAVLRHLRAAHPDCHVFGCWSGDAAFVGASPELLVRCTGSDVRASSLAGSAPRGTTPEEDGALAAALQASPKDRVEHAMVRDALADVLARLCDDVDAPAAPSLFTLPHVHHLHTEVRARLRPGRSLLDLVAALHPTPAVGGLPQSVALQFIRDEERLDRGWYAAPIGWVGPEGGEFAVALRSALVRGSSAWLYAGCGIVEDSVPADEYAETLLKLRPMELALAASFAAPG